VEAVIQRHLVDDQPVAVLVDYFTTALKRPRHQMVQQFLWLRVQLTQLRLALVPQQLEVLLFLRWVAILLLALILQLVAVQVATLIMLAEAQGVQAAALLMVVQVVRELQDKEMLEA